MKEAVWLSGVVGSYAAASKVLERIGKRSMSLTTVWRCVEKWGGAAQAVESERADKANGLPSKGEERGQANRPRVRLGAALDGAMVNIRQEGWKELKVGCVFAIEPQSVLDSKTQEVVEQGHAADLTYAARLGGPDAIGRLLWTEAQRRGWETATDSQFLGDGAAWIWNVADTYFAPQQQTVDWYHAAQHLHAAAQAYHPDLPIASSRWYNAAETLLFQGQAETIVAQLTQRAELFPTSSQDLLAQATYFENNKRRMQYLELRENGYPIGSGMVESTAKQFKARFTGPGMRWSRHGIAHLLPIRSAILSNSFDQLWTTLDP